MVKKTVDETELTRQSLLESGLEVFAKHGVSKTTLEMIAQQAHVSRGCVYWHFKGKDALLKEILEGSLLPFENFVYVGSSLNTNLGRLRLAVLETFSEPRYRQLCQILMHDTAGLDRTTPIAMRFEQAQTRLFSQLNTLLISAIGKGEALVELNVAATCQLLKICLIGLIYDCSNEPLEVRQRIMGALDALIAILQQPPEPLIKRQQVHTQ